MSHHCPALAFRASACALLGATAATAPTPYWPAALGTMGGALALAWYGHCEAVARPRDRADAQRERLADCALAADTTRGWAHLNTACCLRSWESRGAEHDTAHCTGQDRAA
ncbi:hypothetical protein [Streptomyces sp. NRRL B-1347]|uniref:hypothetical protein n=1 Tax=Streptomyces sp. NRRL B-1347 TaxID=1476877 RepID=UPI0004C5E042|nr:hypothetical protein [Streptomyces sp. NRRL B-1347]